MRHPLRVAVTTILTVSLLSACGSGGAPPAAPTTATLSQTGTPVPTPTPTKPPPVEPTPTGTPPTAAPPTNPPATDVPPMVLPPTSPPTTDAPPTDPPPTDPPATNPPPTNPPPTEPAPPAVVPSGQTAIVSWAPVTERTDGTTPSRVAAYRVFFGQDTGNLDRWVEMRDPGITTAQFSGMAPGRWYFLVVAIDSGGLESVPSDPQAYDFA